MTVIDNRFDDRDSMFAALYREIVDAIQAAIKRDNRATLLLSGGSTPAPLYRQLSNAVLDWTKVQIALVDERWVDADNRASNERLLHDSMLINEAKVARFIGMKNSADSPIEGVTECNMRYSDLGLPHTVCLLGMGPDGHTASLFPESKGLAEAFQSSQHCAPILARRSAVTGDLLERMTLTPWSILQSERLFLLITDAEKWQVLQRARDAGDSLELPISHFTGQSTPPLEVYWAP
jgi:6-phosphogluconolactonase